MLLALGAMIISATAVPTPGEALLATSATPPIVLLAEAPAEEAPKSDKAEPDHDPYSRGKRGFDRRRRPTIDGKSRAHFLVWGIIDWGLAIGCWSGATYMGVVSAVFAGEAGRNVTPIDENGLSRQEARALATGFAISAGALVATGIIAAWRANTNMKYFEELNFAYQKDRAERIYKKRKKRERLRRSEDL